MFLSSNSKMALALFVSSEKYHVETTDVVKVYTDANSEDVSNKVFKESLC